MTKRVIALVFFSGLIFLILFYGKALSQNQFSQYKGVSIGASVGSSSLTISGYQSPYASIILKTKNDVFLASTTADANGYFSISNVLINSSELTYCFLATDFKRIGISESCITFEGGIAGDVTKSDIFLPPTIALSKKVIQAGQDASIFGYTMPGAIVSISIDGKIVTVTADATGYYTYLYENVPQGTFTISSTATFANNPSLEPTNNVILDSRSVTQLIQEEGEKVVEQVRKTLPFNVWPFFLLALALLTAIGVLLYKLRFRPWVIFVDFLRRRKKMHHDWFLDWWQ